MLPLHYARHWQVTSAALMASVLAITLMPAMWFWPDRTPTVLWFEKLDKLAHFATFVLLVL